LRVDVLTSETNFRLSLASGNDRPTALTLQRNNAYEQEHRMPVCATGSERLITQAVEYRRHCTTTWVTCGKNFLTSCAWVSHSRHAFSRKAISICFKQMQGVCYLTCWRFISRYIWVRKTSRTM